jgi:hypothetical protein
MLQIKNRVDRRWTPMNAEEIGNTTIKPIVEAHGAHHYVYANANPNRRTLGSSAFVGVHRRFMRGLAQFEDKRCQLSGPLFRQFFQEGAP